MAVDYFLKLDGVPGSSQDDVHTEEIDILNWSWGANQSGTFHVATGGGAGKVNVNDIMITKYVDKATPELVKGCCKGIEYTEAVITCRRAGGDEAQEFLKITMKPVMITSFSTGGTDGEETPTETVSLNFKEFLVDYVDQEDTGAAGAQGTFGYNIAKNVEV